MAKNPAFPFYANDYLVDTLRWSRAMKSLHVDLLCESWANKELRDDNGAPEGLNAADRKIWTKIVQKWKLVDGIWINEKLEKCRIERQNFLNGQSIKGKKSADARKKTQPEGNHGSTVVQPLEDEEESRDLKIQKESKEIEIKLQELDEIYIDQQRPKWGHLDFDFEYRTFCEKVRGSPQDYVNREEGGIRKAFQYQLRHAKNKQPNGKSFSKNDRTEFNQNELAIIQQHASGTEG
jgi:hypothetical protein